MKIAWCGHRNRHMEIIRGFSNRPKYKEYLVCDEQSLLSLHRDKWVNGFEMTICKNKTRSLTLMKHQKNYRGIFFLMYKRKRNKVLKNMGAFHVTQTRVHTASSEFPL